MSHTSSPIHRFSGTYDAFCDPDFTAEISTKMQVPNRISVVGQDEPVLHPPTSRSPNESGKLYMHVPDRILVAGDNKHIEGKDVLPELRLERSLTELPTSLVTLTTPPQTITLDDYNFPTVDEEPNRKLKDATTNHLNRNHLALETFPSNPPEMSSEYYPPTPPGMTPSYSTIEEQLPVLRRQLKNLSRRVLVLEQENQAHQQREIILLSLGVIYFVLKGIVWLHKHW